VAVTDGRYVLTDEGAALEARGPCTLEAPNRASCPAPGLARAQIDLRDRDDTLTADLTVQQSGREDSFLSAYGGPRRRRPARERSAHLPHGGR